MDLPNALLERDKYFHNVTFTTYNYTIVVTNSSDSFAQYDNATVVYYRNVTVPYTYQTAVRDMEGEITVFHDDVFNSKAALLSGDKSASGPRVVRCEILFPYNVSQAILHVKSRSSMDPYLRKLGATVNELKDNRVVNPKIMDVAMDFRVG